MKTLLPAVAFTASRLWSIRKKAATILGSHFNTARP